MKNSLFKSFLIISYFLIWAYSSMAQDPQLTQFNVIPTLYNPAYTGATLECRWANQHRVQWPNVSSINPRTARFDTYISAFDYFDLRSRLGYGGIISFDRAGSFDLQTLQASFLLSHEVRLWKKAILRAGMQVSYIQRSVGDLDLLFEDQINNGVTGEDLESVMDNVNAGDFSLSGGLLLSSQDWWTGVSVLHANRPELSLFVPETDRISRLLTLELGHLRQIGNFETRFQALARVQGGNRQLNLGVTFNSPIGDYNNLVFGTYFRTSTENVDAISPILRWENSSSSLGSITIGYSYDVTTSSLRNLGGAHEFVLVFQCKNLQREKRRYRSVKKRCLRLRRPGDPNRAQFIIENFGWNGKSPGINRRELKKFRQKSKEVVIKRKDFPVMYDH